MTCNQDCDQGKTCDCRENPPLWEIIAVGIWTLLTIFGGFSLFMLCVGYYWYKT